MAMPKYMYEGDVALGGLHMFNIAHGYSEAQVRGMRSGFLSESDYSHLTQCESMEDLRLNLLETDFAPFVAGMHEISPSLLEKKATEKVVQEFKFLRSNAVHPLSTFLDYMASEMMIENVITLLRGSLTGRNFEDLLPQLNPLGLFSDSVMRLIGTFESSPRGFADLYETVLVDTPIGVYFQAHLDAEAERLVSSSELRNVLEETALELLKLSLLKYYMEDFSSFCAAMGGETGRIMGELLNSRADRHSLALTANSFGTALNEPTARETIRKKLYPSIGSFYPAVVDQLSKVDDDAKLVGVVSIYPLYRGIFEKYLNTSPEAFSLDDEFYKNEVMELELAFESQAHMGVFYAYFKLKEQEIRNLVWISECVQQRMKSRIEEFVPIFSSQSPWRCEQTRRDGATR